MKNTREKEFNRTEIGLVVFSVFIYLTFELIK